MFPVIKRLILDWQYEFSEPDWSDVSEEGEICQLKWVLHQITNVSIKYSTSCFHSRSSIWNRSNIYLSNKQQLFWASVRRRKHFYISVFSHHSTNTSCVCCMRDKKSGLGEVKVKCWCRFVCDTLLVLLLLRRQCNFISVFIFKKISVSWARIHFWQYNILCLHVYLILLRTEIHILLTLNYLTHLQLLYGKDKLPANDQNGPQSHQVIKNIRYIRGVFIFRL